MIYYWEVNMNILIIQENGRHKENRLFRECFCLQRAFKNQGYNAAVWGLGHENYNDVIDYESYDLIINLENYLIRNNNIKTLIISIIINLINR